LNIALPFAFTKLFNWPNEPFAWFWYVPVKSPVALKLFISPTAPNGWYTETREFLPMTLDAKWPLSIFVKTTVTLWVPVVVSRFQFIVPVSKVPVVPVSTFSVLALIATLTGSSARTGPVMARMAISVMMIGITILSSFFV
jgi:hypothetical protein